MREYKDLQIIDITTANELAGIIGGLEGIMSGWYFHAIERPPIDIGDIGPSRKDFLVQQ